MKLLGVCVCVCVLGGCLALMRIPEGFILGAATSAYQIEGAWAEDGKGESMWDYLLHSNASHTVDKTNGDIACDSYHLYKTDVQMLKHLGMDAYRFSISWTRILPRGTPDYINPAAVAYYNNLIEELLKNGITPFITIYHWDLPEVFSEKGGWMNDDVVEWFGEYARVLFRLFGDRVKYWMTINEPHVHCYFAYDMALHAPKILARGIGYYQCGRNVLLANAKAYHIYDEEFRKYQGGQIGLVVSAEWGLIKNLEDEEALMDFRAFSIHFFLDPIFSLEGNYPRRAIDRIAKLSSEQNFTQSRLPPFTQHEVNYLRGTADFLGLNHYTTKYIYRNETVTGMYDVPSVNDDAGIGWYMDPTWQMGLNYWTPDYPNGLLSLLHHLNASYPGLPIYITENGIGSHPGLHDDVRVHYLRNYVTAAVTAKAQGVDVRGYFAWTLMDGLEWASGYTLRFGLYEVDPSDPAKYRTPRKSAQAYQHIARTKTIDYNYNPDPRDGLFSTASDVKIRNVLLIVSSVLVLCLSY